MMYHAGEPRQTTSNYGAAVSGGERKRPRRILITGLPGVGKTTLCELFRRAGLEAVDADDTEILKWGHGGVKVSHRNSLGWLLKNRPYWDLSELERLLDQETDVYLFGVAPNTPRALRYFDHVIYLHVEGATLQERKASKPEVKLLVHIQGPVDRLFRYVSRINRKIRCVDAERPPGELYRELDLWLNLTPAGDGDARVDVTITEHQASKKPRP